MNYSEIIGRITENVYRAGIATKILQHMDRIRNVSDTSQSRRWIMELIQNARDTAYDDLPVNIRIELNDTELKFKHSGKPFKIKDILSIINQVSSKTGDENSVGQFGTGFMTTFLLSEQVNIKSYLRDKNPDGTSYLPYKEFSVELDRRGHTKEEILDAINTATESLKKSDNNPENEYFDRTAMNTVFTYKLQNFSSYTSALTGIEDLVKNIDYIMLFSDKIGRIEICVNTLDDNYIQIYKRGETIYYNNSIGMLEITEEISNKDRNILFISENGITLGAKCVHEYANIRYIPLDEDTSRIFIDFPLIGTEKFPFPVVVNCLEFKPNEPRSNITLVDNEHSYDSIKNKELIMSASGIFRKLLEWSAASGCCGIENIIAVTPFEHNRELSDEWVLNNLYGNLYDIISDIKIIRCGDKYLPVCDNKIKFISANSEEEYADVKHLTKDFTSIRTPSDKTDWWSAIKNYPSAENKFISLEKLIETAEEICKIEFSDYDIMADWLFSLFTASMKNSELELIIRSGNARLLMSRANDGTLYSVNEIKSGKNIPDELYEVCEILDELHSPDMLILKDKLVHKKFDNIEFLTKFEVAQVNEYIIKRSHNNKSYPLVNYNARKDVYWSIWWKVAFKLVSFIPDERIYRFFEKVKYKGTLEYKPIQTEVNISIFRYGIFNLLNDTGMKIIEYGDLNSLKTAFFKNEDISDVYIWLQEFYRLSYEFGNDDNLRMQLPNQLGKFGCMNLYSDSVSSEDLKDIISKFDDKNVNYDIRRILVDKNIDTTKFMLDRYTDDMITSKINVLIDECVNSDLKKQPENHQEACTMLLAWIIENPQKARQYFPGYCAEENHIKLQTPAVAVKNYAKARMIDSLCSEFNCSSIDVLKEKILKMQNAANIAENELPNNSVEDTDIKFYIDDMPEEWKIWTVSAQNEYLRQIGNTGEVAVFENIAFRIENYGFIKQTENDQMIVFAKNEKIIKLYRGDNGIYHQAGWDIRVEIEENKFSEIHYVEVKSHTQSSIMKNLIQISNTQMHNAVRYKDKYHVAMVLVNGKSLTATNIDYYSDIMQLVSVGNLKLKNTEYLFYTP